MAYDRYDTRNEGSRWRDEDPGRSERGWRGDDRGGRDERGFFERAGDEISSWFGDDEADRRRREDRMREEREPGFEGRQRYFGADRNPDHNRNADRDRSSWRRDTWASRERDDERFRDRGRDYRPMTGDYGRSEQFFAASGVGR